MSDLLSLDRDGRKPRILEDAKKTHDSRNHGDQSEVLRHEQSREHHNVREIQEELYTLRRRSDDPAGDRSLPQVG